MTQACCSHLVRKELKLDDFENKYPKINRGGTGIYCRRVELSALTCFIRKAAASSHYLRMQGARGHETKRWQCRESGQARALVANPTVFYQTRRSGVLYSAAPKPRRKNNRVAAGARVPCHCNAWIISCGEIGIPYHRCWCLLPWALCLAGPYLRVHPGTRERTNEGLYWETCSGMTCGRYSDPAELQKERPARFDFRLHPFAVRGTERERRGWHWQVPRSGRGGGHALSWQIVPTLVFSMENVQKPWRADLLLFWEGVVVLQVLNLNLHTTNHKNKGRNPKGRNPFGTRIPCLSVKAQSHILLNHICSSVVRTELFWVAVSSEQSPMDDQGCQGRHGQSDASLSEYRYNSDRRG
ncbi:hypothetical protein QBC37DRAFT_479126 [Rhypophila decipiens]|uniref:Uncharacterized protein n=1 Tax=Rhypophila decipiens TaxID=261697 RepID=A0AAN6YJX6_9PEZI|nr:hypothetical protein QBC37DRAFT_479126 [Rhypophila decipiens]